MILYHASVESFNEFDENKITKNETDLVSNGFWFSSNTSTSCAWRNPNYLKTCEVTLNNPISYEELINIHKELGGYYICDCNTLRLELINRGYDGFIMDKEPEIDVDVMNKQGYFDYYSPKGTHYRLKHNGRYVDLYCVSKTGREEFVADYYGLDDFINSQETIVCVFSNKSIQILKEEVNNYWNKSSVIIA